MIFHGGSCTFMGLSQISKRSHKLGSLLSHCQSRSFSCADNVGLFSFRHPCFQSVSLPCLQSSLFAKDSSFLQCFYIFLVEVRDNLFFPHGREISPADVISEMTRKHSELPTPCLSFQYLHRNSSVYEQDKQPESPVLLV